MPSHQERVRRNYQWTAPATIGSPLRCACGQGQGVLHRYDVNAWICTRGSECWDDLIRADMRAHYLAATTKGDDGQA